MQKTHIQYLHFFNNTIHLQKNSLSGRYSYTFGRKLHSMVNISVTLHASGSITQTKHEINMTFNQVKISIVLVVLFILNYETQAQSLFFEHLGIKDGLSQHSVHDIYQDEFEQIWIATSDGLNKYDGNKIEVFKPQIGDSIGLFGNNIQSVTGDKQGKLYIQCLSGLVVYNLYTEKFKTIQKKGVSCLSIGKDRLWIGDGNSIKYLCEEETISVFKELDTGIQIQVILEAADGNLYIGTKTGLFVVDRNAKTAELLNEIHIVCLYEDNMKRIWIGTLKEGLFCLNSRNEISNYRHDPLNTQSLSNDFIRSICQDDLGGFWIGTFNGLDFFNQDTKKFHNFRYSHVDNNSISDMSVWTIKKDKQGSLWIGTFFGGVNIFNPEFSFNRFYTSKENKNSLCGAIVSRIIDDSNGNLWICTDYNGLNLFDTKSNRFTHFKHNSKDKNSLSSNTLKDLLLDEGNNTLWIGSHIGGLDKMDLRTKKIERVPLNTGNKAIDNYVRCIQKYGDDLLLGTHNAIQRYDIKTGAVSDLLHDYPSINKGQVWDMLIDQKGCLWFSIQSSVFCYNLSTNQLQKKPTISEIEHGVFFEDSKGNIWIGSAGKGIFLYDTVEQQFHNYHTENSDLSDNYILDINESATGYILLTTNRGLSRYEPSKNIFYNYYNNQFFPFEALNEKSICVTKNGDIVLSSLSGMLIISEKELLFNSKPYKINLTSLSINNKPVTPNINRQLLKESITATDTLLLKENQNVISIDFAVTNFIKALIPEIQYKLDGFDEEWVDAKSYNITYTNLNPGTYKLKIRGREKASGYEAYSNELTIVVNPHFYKTGYAYIVYILLIMGFLFLIYSQLRLKDSLRNADIQSKHVEEVNQSKLRFFINVSHEIRTPVTLILAQLDMLLNNSHSIPPSIHNKLQNIKKNAYSLKKLINELLDFRKHEQGYAKLKPAQQDLTKYLHNIFSSFQDYANSLNISTSFICSEERIDVYFDSSQMDKVFYNLLSNAFKFTPPLGSVSVIVKKNEDSVEVTVEDTGIGIKQESISEIFNRFYQAQDTDSSIQPLDPGTGIGLALVKNIIDQHHGTISVLSNFGKGTAFKVTLPLGDQHFEQQDIRQEGIRKEETKEQITHDTLDNKTENYRSPDQLNKKILIIEDNDEMRMVLTEIFESIYHVIALPSGEKALDKIKETMPDLILLDIMLPKISGIELCKKIKSDLATRSIPVVLITAAATSEKKLEGLQIGADDYVTKPFDTKELITRCNGLINNRLLLKEAFASITDKDNTIFSINKVDQQLIGDATTFILNNIDNPNFNIDQLASALNISRSSLFTKIKEITGETPKDFIVKLKLKKSIELLRNDQNESISNIAFSVGFSDPSYFIKLFKAHYGITPGQYRNNYFTGKIN